MKEKFKQLLRRRTALFIALLLIAAFAGGAALADFTLSYRAKRVIATYDESNMLFSSNYLLEDKNGDRIPQIRTFYIPQNWNGTIDITVCNYPQGKNTHWNENAIPYVFSAEVVTLEYPAGSTQPQLQPMTVSHGSIEFASNTTPFDASAPINFGTQTLATGGPDEDTYSLTFPYYEETVGESTVRNYYTNCYVLMKAEPTDALAGNLKPLWILLNAQPAALGETELSWNLTYGDFASPPATGLNAYSGFNYQLSGDGKGTVKLSWDSSKLEIDKLFLRDQNILAPTTISGNVVKIELPVDSDTGVNSYNIRFYPADGLLTDAADVTIHSDSVADANSHQGIHFQYTETGGQS